MNSLPHEDLLSTMGEVAAAFVGFSMVVGILRSESDVGKPRFLAMRNVAEIGIGGVIAAFLPLTIHAYGTSPETTWRLASTGFLVFSTIGAIIGWRRARGVLASFRKEPIEAVVTMGLNVGSVGLLSANVVLAGPESGARYTTVVLFLLVLAAMQFVTGAFKRPVGPPGV